MSRRFDPYKLRNGDPVKVAYRQGNFRFREYYDEDKAIIVGPVGGNGEVERIVLIAKLRESKAQRNDVAANPLVIQISATAHNYKKG